MFIVCPTLGLNVYRFLPLSEVSHQLCHFMLPLDFSKQNGVRCVLSNVITSSQRRKRLQRFREQHVGKMISQVRNACRIWRHANNAGLILNIFKFRPMFKQHANLLIWTWSFVHLTMDVNSYTNRYLCKNKVSLTFEKFVVYVTMKYVQMFYKTATWLR